MSCAQLTQGRSWHRLPLLAAAPQEQSGAEADKDGGLRCQTGACLHKPRPKPHLQGLPAGPAPAPAPSGSACEQGHVFGAQALMWCSNLPSSCACGSPAVSGRVCWTEEVWDTKPTRATRLLPCAASSSLAAQPVMETFSTTSSFATALPPAHSPHNPPVAPLLRLGCRLQRLPGVPPRRGTAAG